MAVGMSGLALALAAAPALGLLDGVLLFLLRLACRILYPRPVRAWMHEVFTVVRFLLVTVSLLLFLYATNRGGFRWFLAGGILAGYLFWRCGFGRRLTRLTDGALNRLRALFVRALFWITAPVRRCVRWLMSCGCALCVKTGLLWREQYDKMLVRRYDRKKRRGVAAEVRREIAALTRGWDTEHEGN